MKVLVTGANGMLGQDLCPILEDEDFDVIETDIHNLDITDLKQVEKVLIEEMPDYVVHCAAYTNVDKAEEDKENAFKLNSDTTKNIVDVCKKYDMKHPVLIKMIYDIDSGKFNSHCEYEGDSVYDDEEMTDDEVMRRWVEEVSDNLK